MHGNLLRTWTVVCLMAGASGVVHGQNLLHNPRFATGIEDWTPSLGPGSSATFVWDSVHNSEGLGGSAQLASPIGIVGFMSASQCVPVTPGLDYDWGGDLVVLPPVNSMFSSLDLLFQADTACSSSLGSSVSVLPDASAAPGSWVRLAGQRVTAPAGSQSVQFVMLTGSAGLSVPNVANFDNLYFGRAGTVPGSLIPEVPALSRPGLLALAMIVGASALLVLRRLGG